jgi:cytochrome b involved in lipid metabolism
LFIFGVVVTSIMTAGLVFYQNGKDNNQVNGTQAGSLVKGTVNQLTASGKTITLNMAEISQHNKTSNCWLLISGKVYDITGYFGSHPGGNSTMSATCGKDATAAYTTKDPYANSTSGGSNHSSGARGLLTDYYIGDFNSTIGAQTNKTATTLSSSSNTTQSNNTQNTNQVKNNTTVVPPATNVTLSLSEIAKHNKSTDCWFLISGKVYNITSYFGSHPGGNSTMSATCGKDATAAYMTKDPSATASGSRSSHSGGAQGLLSNYLIGNLNQTVGSQNVAQASAVVAPPSRGGDDWEDD